MTALLPAERPDWCPDCGTAPCAHLALEEPGGSVLGHVLLVVLLAVMVLAFAAAGALLAGTWTP